MIKQILFILFISLSGTYSTLRAQPSKIIQLPVDYNEGRFFLKMPTVKGDTIIGYCDTGGGFTAVYKSTMEKIGLTEKVKSINIDGEVTRYIHAAEFLNNQAIPYPAISPYFRKHFNTPIYEVPEDNEESRMIQSFVNHGAFLGQFFFINHSWTFDYKTGKMYINTPLVNDPNNVNMQVLGFKKDKKGNKRFGHPSMKLQVDGKEIDFLFDTGAMILLSSNGMKQLASDEKVIGGSFIAASVFNEWKQLHPDWRIIEKGEITGADLIEVPQVKFGNLTAGPVWFAKRPDEAWSKGMIGSMDKVVKGAIGGSYLKYFKVTIDYNSELIQFE